MKRNMMLQRIAGLVLFAAAIPAQADVVTLTTLTDSIMVGQEDTNPGIAPLAPGDGWFTSTYAGTVRARSVDNQEQLRTQWYIRFDITALDAVAAGDITNATLNLPQIGRLNSITTLNKLMVFDVNASWDTAGSNYPVWNLGREAPQGSPGGTLLKDFGSDSYQTFDTNTDVSDTDVEGVFLVDTAELLATVQSWAASPSTDNEGFLVTFINPYNGGLAFGAPSLELSVIPEPGSALLLLLGGLLFRYGRRAA